MDLPTVGEVTIENLAEAGLKGLALEAGASQILNPSETISHADSNRIFVIGVTKEDLK